MGDDEDDGLDTKACKDCCCPSCERKVDGVCPYCEEWECPGLGFTCVGFKRCPFLVYEDEEE